MFTPEERENIENWKRLSIADKAMCHWLKEFTNRILESKGLPQEKRECFCAKPRRNKYKAIFYKLFDEQNL